MDSKAFFLRRWYYENRYKLPECVDDLITYLYHRFARIPYIGTRPTSKLFEGVEIVPFKYDRKGAFCVSTTLELAWGWRYGKNKKYRSDFPPLGRKNAHILLELSEQYSIPITWAVVGHLFLQECKRHTTGLAHHNMPRPNGFYERHHMWDWLSGDWYQNDPCSNVEKEPLWYATDLINKIINSPISQEIGTHSFSHIDFSHPSCSTELARSELEECIKVMRKYGLTPRSMVFPGGLADCYLDILASSGIIAYQGGLNKMTYPERKEEGIWNINGSLYLTRGRGYDYYKRAMDNINKAIENHLVFNLVLSDPMFYPFEHAEAIKYIFENVLRYAYDQRTKDLLWITTLSEIARYCEARETTRVNCIHNQNEIMVTISSILDHQRFGYPEITLKVKIPNNLITKRVECETKKVVLGTEDCYSISNENTLVVTVPVSTKNIKIQIKEA